jgi:hypothetical protein
MLGNIATEAVANGKYMPINLSATEVVYSHTDLEAGFGGGAIWIRNYMSLSSNWARLLAACPNP